MSTDEGHVHHLPHPLFTWFHTDPPYQVMCTCGERFKGEGAWEAMDAHVYEMVLSRHRVVFENNGPCQPPVLDTDDPIAFLAHDGKKEILFVLGWVNGQGPGYWWSTNRHQLGDDFNDYSTIDLGSMHSLLPGRTVTTTTDRPRWFRRSKKPPIRLTYLLPEPNGRAD